MSAPWCFKCASADLRLMMQKPNGERFWQCVPCGYQFTSGGKA